MRKRKKIHRFCALNINSVFKSIARSIRVIHLCIWYLTVFAKTCPQLTLRQSQWPGVFWPPPWLGQYPPPRQHVTGTSPAGGHVNTEHSSKPKQLNKHSQWQNYLALKLTRLTKGRCAYKTPFPAPCFWQLAPCKPPADSPCTGPSTWTRLDGAPLGLESPARPGFGLCPNPGENLRACSCEYGQIYIMLYFYRCNSIQFKFKLWLKH